MDKWLNLAVLLLIPFQCWLFVKLFKTPRNLPPGPFRLPIIGNLHNIGKSPHKSLAELAKIHGPLMSLQLGSLTTIVGTSPFVTQQILQKHDLVFCNRWVPDAVNSCQHSDFSMAFLPPKSSQWRNIRKLCSTQLFSNRGLDASKPIRQKKVEELISYIDGCRRDGVAVNISEAVFSSNLKLVSNTLLSMDLEDPNSAFCREFRENILQQLSIVSEPNIGDYFPLFKGLDLQRTRRRMEERYTKIITFFQRIIDERLAKGADRTAADSNDVLDAFLKMNKDKKEEFGVPYTIHSLLVSQIRKSSSETNNTDLFIGGTDTTSGTIEWAMAELLRAPNKLKKAQGELLQIIGKGNPLKEEDTVRLPYLQAVVKETLRLHPVLPMLLPRLASSNIELCGFQVPKNSQVLINVWAIGRDPSVWERPSSFEPERFLGSEIDFKGLHFEFAAFGGGRRICPGLPLAIRNVSLILGSLIHSFDWKLENGVKPENLDMDEEFGITLHKAKPLLTIPVSRG